MASRKRLTAVTGSAAAAATAAPGKAVVGAPDAHPKRDLNDVQTQESILRPAPAALTICGQAVTLHPLPARLQRQFAGLCGQIIAEAAGRPGNFQMRLKNVLAESYDLSAKFFNYVSRATFTPDFKITTEIAEQINLDAARYIEEAKYNEIGPLFDAMSDLNHILEAFSSPK